jgi:hypothetical protein
MTVVADSVEMVQMRVAEMLKHLHPSTKTEDEFSLLIKPKRAR